MESNTNAEIVEEFAEGPEMSDIATIDYKVEYEYLSQRLHATEQKIIQYQEALLNLVLKI